jgi:hypothetical protein
MKKAILFITALVISSVIYSCGALTYINDTWQKPGYTARKYNKIVVWAVFKDNLFARRVLEDKIVSDLKAQGINAVPSYDKFSNDLLDPNKTGKIENEEEGEDILMKAVKDMGVDGALVVSVKDIKKDSYYEPGYSYWTPRYYSMPFRRYYISTYDRVYGPGYYTTSSLVYFESGLFDLNKEELIYSVISETVNPTSLKDIANSFSTTLVKTLLEGKVILK